MNCIAVAFLCSANHGMHVWAYHPSHMAQRTPPLIGPPTSNLAPAPTCHGIPHPRAHSLLCGMKATATQPRLPLTETELRLHSSPLAGTASRLRELPSREAEPKLKRRPLTGEEVEKLLEKRGVVPPRNQYLQMLQLPPSVTCEPDSDGEETAEGIEVQFMGRSYRVPAGTDQVVRAAMLERSRRKLREGMQRKSHSTAAARQRGLMDKTAAMVSQSEALREQLARNSSDAMDARIAAAEAAMRAQQASGSAMKRLFL